jgi:2-polyprenyl-3-methyl-5-hydroxy-6-metoxy-1,4-benzoquinol methylase
MNLDDRKTVPPRDVTAELAAFYERHPYPAPITNLDRHRELYKDPARGRAQFHLLWPTGNQRTGLEILVAGCGTSQAATYALREPDARITAIDISEVSLRHTRDLKRKYGLDNLEVIQRPIESVGELRRSFDQVVCTGVLHHLADPDIGLHALRAVLKPQGAMHLMVYAVYGRTGIYMMQEYCRLLGLSTGEEDLRDLAATIGALPADHPIARVLSQAKDFRHPDALADALLHPRDRAYTVPQLYAWLDRCGLSFGRWFEQAPYLPQCGVLAKLPHSAGLCSLSTRSQHAAVELFRGTMTRHNLIAYRDDFSGDSQPIAFDRSGWQDYIPLRLPWTLDIREPVPPGYCAVLVNRAHAYPDLALPIDSAEARLLDSIDGKRAIGEIARAVGCGETRAFRLFERLWQYDQVVFDLSRTVEPAFRAPGHPKRG